MTVGSGTTAGLLLVAVIVRTCRGSPGPTVIPVRGTVLSPEFSRTVTGATVVIVGAWLTGVTTTLNDCENRSTPLFAVPPSSSTVTVIRAEPAALGSGVYLSV